MISFLRRKRELTSCQRRSLEAPRGAHGSAHPTALTASSPPMLTELESSLPAVAPATTSAFRSSPPREGSQTSAEVVTIDTSPFVKMEEQPLPATMANDEPVNADAAEAATQAQPPRRLSSTDTERPLSGQRTAADVKDDEHSQSDEEDEEDADPAVEIKSLDWTALERRYHNAIRNCEANETELLQEFDSLMNVLSTSPT